MPEKVVIIGSGPAGWSAAIYAARASLEPLLFEGTAKPEMIPLGQLAYTTEVETMLAFRPATSAPLSIAPLRRNDTTICPRFLRLTKKTAVRTTRSKVSS